MTDGALLRLIYMIFVSLSAASLERNALQKRLVQYIVQ